ncbi:MAG TPA: hypothetical protein VFP54_10980 [Acidimicrobiales bacterium]|nr:hypothetical protein [Acidimicrobiales bacterium]
MTAALRTVSRAKRDALQANLDGLLVDCAADPVLRAIAVEEFKNVATAPPGRLAAFAAEVVGALDGVGESPG